MGFERVTADCLKRWGSDNIDDKRLLFFRDRFNEWITQIPPEYHATVISIFNNFHYYTRQRVNMYLENLHSKLLSLSNVTYDNTVFAYIKSKDGLSNSSNDYWFHYKDINSISKNICFENLKRLPSDDLEFIENIVFIDDFSGSGRSLTTELECHAPKFKGKTIILIAINVIDEAIRNIESFCKDNCMEFHHIVVDHQEKAFETDFFDDNEKAKNEVIMLSKLYGMKDEKRQKILGWEDSQALVAFYNNTPNNTLKFIWFNPQKGSGYFPIFPRNSDYKPLRQRPTPGKMNRSKDARKAQNYSNTIMCGG